MFTRVDDEGLFVKNILKINKEDLNVENRRIENVANPEIGADAVNLSTFNDFKQEIIQDQILNNLRLSEDISKNPKIYQSADNILTRIDD